jgi:hypothetical protein
MFWQDTAKLAAAIVVAQAIVVGLAAGWWIRRIRPVSPISPVSPTPQSAS